MSIEWFKLDWDGHRRGTLQFRVFYNPEKNEATYDAVAHSHLNYLESAVAKARSECYVPEHNPVESSSTVKEAVVFILSNNSSVQSAYDSYLRKCEVEKDKSIIDWAYKYFSCEDEAYINSIWNLTFQEKTELDASKL